VTTKKKFRYRAFGLTISSAIECPQLRRDDGRRKVDVTITTGTVPEITDPDKRTGFKFEAGKEQLLIITDTIARILVSSGSHILVEPLVESKIEDIRMLLLGWGLGALLHQRGVLPLHAASVANQQGSCIVFCADSGMGKSTLAAAFLHKGYRLLDDNTTAIDSKDHKLLVLPGTPELKLHKDSIALWPDDWTDGIDSLPSWEKDGLLMQNLFEEHPRPLSAIFILTSHGSSKTGIKQMRGGEAFHLINRHIFCRDFLSGMGGTANNFNTIINIANKVPIYSLELSSPKPHPDELFYMIETLLER
jgi:hypothetical protein